MKLIKLNMNRIFAIIFIILFIVACSDDIPDQPNFNKPPETSVFISYKDTLNYTTSVRSISWYGDDADGFVVGYYLTWEENPTSEDWVFTTRRDSIFPLQIQGLDTIYTFKVKAVDDDGMEDPTPAEQRFPIKNSAPVMKWVDALSVPDTIFTIATFFWSVTDLDGDSTIAYYEYILDDTTDNWNTFPGDSLKYLTLREADGLVSGPHSFYIRAVDLAGAKSQVIRMPEDPLKYFYVKAPVGNFLLIDDYFQSNADDFYKGLLDTLVGEYTYWDLKENLPPSTIPFTETLSLFRYVIWYADLTPHLTEAQIAIPEFRNPLPGDSSRKILFSMQFNQDFANEQGNPLEFSPIANLDSFFNRITTDKILYPDTTDSYIRSLNLPELKVSETKFGVNTLIPNDNAHVLYRYNITDSLETDPILGVLGENDNIANINEKRDFVFFAFPIQSLNGNNNATEFVSVVFRKIFGMKK